MAFPVLLAIQAGLLITSYLIRRAQDDEEDPTDPNTARRGSSTVAEEGTTPALVLGKARVRKTNVLMYRGAGSFQDYMRESKFNDNFPFYRVNLQLGVCVRPLSNTIVQFKRIWAGDTLIADSINVGKIIKHPDIWGGFKKGGGVGVAPLELGAFSGGNLAVSLGAANAAELGVGTGIAGGGPNVNNDLTTDDHYGAAPGLCTIFLENFQVGERPAMFGLSAEMVVWPDYTGTIESRVNDVSEVDANPAAALYQILTDDLIGINLDPAIIDAASFNTAAITLNAEEHGFSIAVDKVMSAQALIEIIISQIDAALYTDPETQLITLKLIREDYGAFPYGGLDLFDEGNVLEVVQYKQTSWEDTYSQVRVKYEDREVEYAERHAVAHDLAAAASAGRLRSRDLEFRGVKTAALAGKIASREMKFYGVPQTLVTLKMNREAGILRPGYVFKWTNTEYGITNMVLRVQQIDFGAWEQGVIVVQCSQDNDSNLSSVFRDPSRHWIEDFGFPIPAPDCIAVAELPPNPFFEDGGSNWNTPMEGIVAAFIGLDSTIPASPTTEASGSLADLKINVGTLDSADTLLDVGNEQDSTRCASIGTAYSKTAGGSSYYDISAGGLDINLADSSVLRNSTEAEVRQGRAVLLVGGIEYISYESFTALGGDSYRLNNVWRGLFDTIAEDHLVDASVFFVSEVNMGRATIQTKYRCGHTAQFRMRPTIAQGRQDGQADFLYSEVLITRRGAKASRATNFALYDEGFDAVGAQRDVEYGFDPADPKAVIISPFTGDDAAASTSDLGQVFTNDLRADWRRRPIPTDCDNVVVRGDDADIPFPPGDTTRLLAEAKRDVDADFFELADRGFNGEDRIVGSGDFFNMGRLLPGPGTVRLTSKITAADTGQELSSHKAEEIFVDMIGCRQLLINRKLRPYWDIGDPRGSGGFGKGYQIMGNGDHLAREWRSIGDIEPTFGRGDLPIDYAAPTAPLEQGDHTEGHSFYSQENATGLWAEIEQIIPAPYLDTEGSEIWLSWHYFRYGVGTDEYRVSVETLDANGTVLETATTGEVTGTHARGWKRIELTLATLSAGVTALRVTLGVTSTVATNPNRIGNVTAFMGRDISAQILLDEDFNDIVTNWTQTGSAWSSVGVVGALQELDTTRATFLYAPAAGAPAQIEQDQLVPVDYGAGDWVRLEFWTANTGSNDTISAKLEARDSANAIITWTASSSYNHANTDQWYAHEVWLELPPLVDDINVIFIAKDGGGGGQLEVAVAESNVRFIKADARSTFLNYSVPTIHVAPITPDAFEAAAETCGVRPSHIFPMQDGSGVAPVDVLQGVVLDGTVGTVDDDFSNGAPAIGLYSGVDQISDLALELSKTDGGIKCSDTEFLNPNNASFGIYFQFRLTGVDHIGNANIIMKANGLPTPTDGSGFQAFYEASSRKIKFFVTTNHVGGSPVTATCEVAAIPEDGAWHWAYFKFDTTAELASIFSDYAAGTTASLTTFLAEEMSNIIDEVYLGRNDIVGGTFDDGFDSPFQIRYLAAFRGEHAEKFTRTAGQNMWKHGRDPNEDLGHDLTYTRGKELLVPITDNHVGVFGGSTGGGLVQVPLQHDTNFAGAKLGLASHEVTQNIVPFSEDFTDASWTKTACTVTAKNLISPRGVREMQIITQAAAAGNVDRVITGLTASTTYRLSLYIETVATDHDVQVLVTQGDLSTTLVSNLFAATQTAKRYTFTFATQAGQTQTRIRCYGGTAASASGIAGIFGLMIQEGEEFGPVVLNYDATLNSSDATVQSITTAVNELTVPEEGAVQAHFVVPVAVSSERAPWSLWGAVGDEDARVCRIQANGLSDFLVYGAAGVLDRDCPDHPILTASTEINRVIRWRAKTDLEIGAFGCHDIQGATTQTSTSGYTAGDGHSSLFVGCDRLGARQLNGVLQDLKIWKGEPRSLDF